MTWSRKVDDNQGEIVEALRKAGCLVADASKIGKGFPDLIVARPNQKSVYLVEVKNKKARGKLNKLQQRFHAEWQGQVDVVYSPEDALRLVGLLK